MVQQQTPVKFQVNIISSLVGVNPKSLFKLLGYLCLLTEHRATMGRIKTTGGTSVTSRELKGAEGNSGRDNSSNLSSNYAANTDLKLKEALKELHSLTHQVQEERSRGEHNLSNISKTHEKIQQEIKSMFENSLTGTNTSEYERIQQNFGISNFGILNFQLC
jgi:hypothetical protein